MMIVSICCGQNGGWLVGAVSLIWASTVCLSAALEVEWGEERVQQGMWR